MFRAKSMEKGYAQPITQTILLNPQGHGVLCPSTCWSTQCPQSRCYIHCYLTIQWSIDLTYDSTENIPGAELLKK